MLNDKNDKYDDSSRFCVDEDESDARGTLTRLGLAQAIFTALGGVSRREAKRLADCVIDEIIDVLASGETLKLHDFGSFIVREKNERLGRNPRTGGPVSIDARRVIVFKASPNMKAVVDGATKPRRAQMRPARKAHEPISGDLPAIRTAFEKP